MTTSRQHTPSTQSQYNAAMNARRNQPANNAANAKPKPWGGRFRDATDARVEKFTASLDHDRRLYRCDIRGSIAHARMLAAVGLLTADELAAIERGLSTILQQIESGEFVWDEQLEDVHMNIEARLIELVGDAGKKLHTARSRNDQVATDLRLYLREHIDKLCGGLHALQRVIVEFAAREADTLMPGFTHLQTAQPITFGHHLLAWNEMLARDDERLRDCRRRVNRSPLGACALAGTGFAIDRNYVATELGFDSLCNNSLDAVSDRDFAVEFCAHAALLMVHLSRIAEEIILWCSDAFGFVTVGDSFCTGSSIMPQKKNPDVAELIRGKCARACGNVAATLMLMKAQPLAYNRDNQEDKAPLFDSIDTVSSCVDMLAALLNQTAPQRETMRVAAMRGHSTATDLADYLVGKNVPFRDAHEAVGKAVGLADARQVQLAEMDWRELHKIHPAIDEDVHSVLDIDGSVRARQSAGGTAPAQVIKAAERALREIDARARDDEMVAGNGDVNASADVNVSASTSANASTSASTNTSSSANTNATGRATTVRKKSAQQSAKQTSQQSKSKR